MICALLARAVVAGIVDANAREIERLAGLTYTIRY